MREEIFSKGFSCLISMSTHRLTSSKVISPRLTGSSVASLNNEYVIIFILLSLTLYCIVQLSGASRLHASRLFKVLRKYFRRERKMLLAPLHAAWRQKRRTKKKQKNNKSGKARGLSDGKNCSERENSYPAERSEKKYSLAEHSTLPHIVEKNGCEVTALRLTWENARFSLVLVFRRNIFSLSGNHACLV